MLNHLETLCGLCGVSGEETAVRNYIVSQIQPFTNDFITDPLGNLIVRKKGRRTPPKSLMIGAHMDEVGLIVTYINEDGTLKVAPVGGIDPAVVLGRQVCAGEQALPGVIGSKPIHLLSKEERKTVPDFSKMVLDIGAPDKEAASALLKPGDFVHFLPGFTQLGGGKIRSKALDDRIGCAILLDLIASDLEYDTTFTFHVQEEIGLRGSRTAAYTVAPDLAIVLEGTTASDIPGAEGDAAVCALGKGSVVSYMDHSTFYDRELYQLAFSLAEENGIPCQTKSRIAGGNDSGAIHLSRGGVRTIAISAPCRYIHSPSSVAQWSDLEACEALTKLLMEKAVLL